MSKMYFAETSCDRLSEDTVAFLISSIPTRIPPLRDNTERRLMFEIPMVTNPRALYSQNYWGYPSVFGGADNMYNCLLQEDHYFKVDDLRVKLKKFLRRETDGSRLVAVGITDGRLVFNFWEPSGFQIIKVLPALIEDSLCFDFALRLGKRSNGEVVRIAYMSSDYVGKEGWHCYRVEQFRWVGHGSSCREEITTAKDIFYRKLENAKDEVPHFVGYMETTTVH